jgi:PadR family transcriptional regulator, regulatory protein PadR
MIRDFFLGFIKIHILHHAAEEPVFGLALIAELKRHGYSLSAGTLYPILHELEGSGYIVRENRTVGGKVRKYYTTTDEGKKALSETKHKIRELVYEVLEEQDPKHLPSIRTKGAKKGSKVQKEKVPMRD